MPESTESTLQLFRERIMAEDSLLNSRTTIFLATNGLLFAAVGLGADNPLKLGVAILGTAVTTLWIMCSLQVLSAIKSLTISYLEISKKRPPESSDLKMVEAVVQGALWKPYWIRPTDLLAKWLPMIFGTAWLLLLAWLTQHLFSERHAGALILALVFIASGLLTTILAGRKGRSETGWGLFGLLAPVALLVLDFFPDLCQKCEKPISREHSNAGSCPHCNASATNAISDEILEELHFSASKSSFFRVHANCELVLRDRAIDFVNNDQNKRYFSIPIGTVASIAVLPRHCELQFWIKDGNHHSIEAKPAVLTEISDCLSAMGFQV